MLWASIVLLPILIIFAGAALQRAFENSLLTAEESQARLHAYALLGSAEVIEGQLVLPRRLQEPRFSQLQSGLAGLVFDADGTLRWRSESSALLDDQFIASIAKNPPKPGSSRFVHLKSQGRFLYVYPLVWETEGREQQYLFAIVHTDSNSMDELTTFQAQLWGWLSAVYLLALVVQYLILRWGLQPLERLAEDLSSIERGEREQLSGRYPDEVEPVTRNLNRLIETERRQRERYRNTLADLAHSLKTPLAVMRGAANESQDLVSYRQLIEEQTERMNQIVQYQLSRAVKSKGPTLAQGVEIEHSVKRIIAALEKVYAEKGILAEVANLAAKRFGGDERDLLELLGNLLENAFKYGRSRVQVSADLEGEMLAIRIADDGAGIGEDSEQIILERGARLDTSRPGQGIGLAVCADILSSYNGSLEVHRSALGGAEFVIRVPAGRV